MKALDTGPGTADGRTLSWVLWAMQYDWDWQRAERELRLAIAGAPNAAAEQYYAFFLIFRGRFREADEHLCGCRTWTHSPPRSRMNLGIARFLEGRFGQDHVRSRNRWRRNLPKCSHPNRLIAGSYIAEGHPELALPILRQLEHAFPPDPEI